ncbi:MAG: hypothetical protein ACR2F2_00055 [Pyrinomonadaceae bacterium]
MSDAVRFPYLSIIESKRPTDLMPYLPLQLARHNKSKNVLGLVDSGASINVLPYQTGIDLGAVLEDQLPLFGLSGNLADYEAKGLILTASVANFSPVELAFGWTKADNIPVILGQVNFFNEFKVCFLRFQDEFEISKNEQ